MRVLRNLSIVAAGILVFFSSLSTGEKAVYSKDQGGPDYNGRVYLPVVTNQISLKTVFGIQMPEINDENGFQEVLDAKSYWVRRSHLAWSLVEPVEGEYNWDQPVIAALEEDLIRASANGLEVILVIHQTPGWAQKIPGYTCGPVKSNKVDAFANFVYHAVSRYSVPPYNVRYWQIWNEPEAEHAVVPPTIELGCCGDPGDSYFGGGYFGDVLKVVYPKLKEANQNAKLVLGGLLLACHPDRQECPSPSELFFEGILNRNGARDGGNFIDVIAFHAYDNYYGALGAYGNVNWYSSWDDEGPAIIAKGKYVRKVMQNYGVNLPVLVTEAALLCGASGTESYCLTSDFEKTKAYYVAQLYGASLAEGFETTIWYHILGWRKSELLKDDLQPLPAYDAYKFARQELRNGTFVRQVQDYEGLMIYEINRSGKKIWLMWSQVGRKEINLPGNPEAIWDVYGNPVENGGRRLVVTLMPLYVEWPLP